MPHSRLRRAGAALFSLLLLSLLGTHALAQTEASEAPPPPAVEQPPDAVFEVDPAAAGQTLVEQEPVSVGRAFVTKVREGGWSMLALLAFSVFAAGVVVERLVNLRQSAILPTRAVPEIERAWAERDFPRVEELCRRHPSVFSSIMLFLSENRTESKELLLQDANELGRQMLQGHTHKIYGLAVVATLSPLVGLFGTILGMIQSFDTVALMGNLGDASMLAGGISKALVTTAGGLLVAIPALGFYHYFKGKINKGGSALEQELTRLMRRWFRGAAPAQAEPTPAREAKEENIREAITR